MNDDKGLTLIELLISTAIISILIVGISIMLLEQQRQFDYARETSDIESTGKDILSFISKEIRSADVIQFTDGDPSNFTPDKITIFRRNTDVLSPTAVYESELGLIKSSAVNWTSSSLQVTGMPSVWNSNLTQDEPAWLGFRSGTKLCDGESTATDNSKCVSQGHLCSRCSVILKADTYDKGAATFTANSLEYSNIPGARTSIDTTFATKFFHNIVSTPMETSLMKSSSFQVDTANMELEMNDSGSSYVPIAGGLGDDVGVVDLQFVFNVGDTAAGTDVGDTTGTAATLSQEQERQLRSVDVILVLRSQWRLQDRAPDPKILAIANVAQRDTGSTPPLDKGYLYKIFRNSVHIRNK